MHRTAGSRTMPTQGDSYTGLEMLLCHHIKFSPFLKEYIIPKWEAMQTLDLTHSFYAIVMNGLPRVHSVNKDNSDFNKCIQFEFLCGPCHFFSALRNTSINCALCILFLYKI